MKIAMLAPIAWRTPPKKYGPWEKVTSLLTEALVELDVDVTLFATGNSHTSAKLEWVCPLPYAEDEGRDAKVWESLHIAHLMQQAERFDIIHNQFDFLPLTFSRLIDTPMVTTIHGFSSEKILPVYKKYNPTTSYISISDADRHPELKYLDTVYHGIDSNVFAFRASKQNYLLFYGRIHPEKGAHTAIEIAKACGMPLKIAGLIQDTSYFNRDIAPHITGGDITYLGNVGQEEGSALLGNAKALLHPIYFNEPFGLSVAESLMCGTPVIAFDRGSMRELLEDGKTGFLVNSVKEAVIAVSRLNAIDPFYCRAHAQKKFSIERMAKHYLDLYRQVLELNGK
ncbi:MAG TPA: glycosyltransferase family 4 protein [Pricia sp.]|nr:glycosyltransferase family 4 protein [Pricia sp.]